MLRDMQQGSNSQTGCGDVRIVATKEEINEWLESCPTKDFMIVMRGQSMWTIRVIIDDKPEKKNTCGSATTEKVVV